MTSYRLYFMNRKSGHIDRFEEFEASNDLRAREIAALRLGDGPAELWTGHRKVERFANDTAFRSPLVSAETTRAA